MLTSVIHPSIKKIILALVGNALTQKVVSSANAILDERGIVKIATFANPCCPNLL
jgi:RNA-binding protein YhbY